MLEFSLCSTALVNADYLRLLETMNRKQKTTYQETMSIATVTVMPIAPLTSTSNTKRMRAASPNERRRKVKRRRSLAEVVITAFSLIVP